MKKKLLAFGKIGYNNFHFTNDSSNGCDTLICRGSGSEVCKTDKNITEITRESSKYTTFNEAIPESENVSVKENKRREFEMTANGKKLSVSFKNTNKKGEEDMIITLL